MVWVICDIDIDEINDEMLIDFLTIVNWSKQNKLPINYNKSTYMILGAKRRLQDTFELLLSIDDKKIEKVSKQKLLGIFIDEHLTWTPHIDYLCSLISSKISFLNSYRHMHHKIFKNYFIKPISYPELITDAIHGALPRAQISTAFPKCKNVPPASFCKRNILHHLASCLKNRDGYLFLGDLCTTKLS